MSGFHLNGIIDYPGEGVALIGMLDCNGRFERYCHTGGIPSISKYPLEEDRLKKGKMSIGKRERTKTYDECYYSGKYSGANIHTYQG
jgi:hypothetical protein